MDERGLDPITLTTMVLDPYRALGLAPDATEAEVRAAYHRAVQRHHPDHNHGSAESTRRFEEVQEAYAQIRRGLTSPSSVSGGGRPQSAARDRGQAQPRPGPDRDSTVEARLADLERELRETRQARERAGRAAREAAADRERARRAAREAAAEPERPSDEELGYVKTDDSFAKILADARTELFERLDEARRDDH